MEQTIIVVLLTVIYTVSSYIGLVLFFYMWRISRGDRIGVEGGRFEDPKDAKRSRTVARRNEVFSGVFATVFCIYSIAGTMGTIRAFDLITLPWEPGLVTTFLLVAANVLEMLLAIVIVRARREINKP